MNSNMMNMIMCRINPYIQKNRFKSEQVGFYPPSLFSITSLLCLYNITVIVIHPHSGDTVHSATSFSPHLYQLANLIEEKGMFSASASRSLALFRSLCSFFFLSL